MDKGGPDGSFSTDEIWKIARYQKLMLIAACGYLVTLLSLCMIPSNFILMIITLIITLALYITASILAFILLIKIHGLSPTLVLGFLMLNLIVNVVVFIMINNQANDILKRHGIKIGFFGAK